MNKHITIKHRVKENPVSFGLISVLAYLCKLLGGKPRLQA